MGKSSNKRTKVVSLTKVKKKGKDLKLKLIQKIWDLLDKFSTVFVFQYSNFKAAPFHAVRDQWRETTKFVLGKAKILRKAIGTSPSNEQRPQLSGLASHLVHTCGLAFTNTPEDQLIEFFTYFREEAYLTPGQIAIADVSISEGVGTFSRYSNTIEPYLRTLGLPTRLHRGQIEMTRDFQVCRAGQELTPEQCKILVTITQKLLEQKHTSFAVELKGMWKDGVYRDLN